MPSINPLHYKCPVCNNPLERKDRMYVCMKNHTFDLSSDGYLNLLLANQKHSKAPGDSREMISARHRFLNSGHYGKLSTAINEIISKELVCSRTRNCNLLDAGCGEGYYLDELHKSMPREAINYWGIDISKDAIRQAAKRTTEINWAVSGVFDLPFMARSFDCIYSVFAPVSEPEFARVLKDNGLVIIVTPGAHHLWGLKQLLYDVPYANEEEKFHPAIFKTIDVQHLKYEFTLDSPQLISDLIAMTPYYWNTGMSKIAAIQSEVSSLTTQAEFVISVFRT